VSKVSFLASPMYTKIFHKHNEEIEVFTQTIKRKHSA